MEVSVKGFIAVLGILLLVGVVAIGGWAVTVAWSGPKGAGEAIKQRNSKVNRIGKQEMFEQLSADFDGYLVQIVSAAAALKTASPATKPQRETELLGLRQVCVSAAQQFNAESRKYTSRVWKSAGLPATLDPSACQEGTRELSTF